MASWSAAAALSGYRLFGLVARPVVPIMLATRVRKGKEDPDRLAERYGKASAPRPPGRLAWVHAASVGETIAAIPLVERIVIAGLSVVMTTVTVTAAKVAAERLPGGAIHQFSPLDSAPWIGEFIGHWRPDFALLVESEIWPQTIMSLSAAGIPQIVVNGRFSERSFVGWKRFASIADALFSKLTLCLAQSEADAARYRALGVSEVIVTGNLKLDAPPPGADSGALATIKGAISTRPVWIAASTHPGEEEMIADVHATLRASRPNLLTIIVPRHADRGAALAAMLKGRGLAVASRSTGEPIRPDTAIYLADTMGELGLLYRSAPIAFMGGSLVPHGGQNPIEPIRLDAVVLHGPHVHNFAEIYAAIDRAYPAGRVADPASLAAAVDHLLGDPAAQRQGAGAAHAALEPFSGALEKTIRALSPFMASPAGHDRSPLAAARPT